MLEKLYAEQYDHKDSNDVNHDSQIETKMNGTEKRPYEDFKEQISKRREFKFGYGNYLIASILQNLFCCCIGCC